MQTSTISDFKAHLSERLRSVRSGERIIILDRDHPVAELRPFEGTVTESGLRRARKPFAIPPGPDWSIDVDAASLLAAERG